MLHSIFIYSSVTGNIYKARLPYTLERLLTQWHMPPILLRFLVTDCFWLVLFVNWSNETLQKYTQYDKTHDISRILQLIDWIGLRVESVKLNVIWLEFYLSYSKFKCCSWTNCDSYKHVNHWKSTKQSLFLWLKGPKHTFVLVKALCRSYRFAQGASPAINLKNLKLKWGVRYPYFLCIWSRRPV